MNADKENAVTTRAITITGSTEPRVDSRMLAAHMGRQHRSVQKLLRDYRGDFMALGHMRFEIAHGERVQGGGAPERYALLNEDQCYLLLTYMRNTDLVRAMKLKLVQAFAEARQAAALHAEYLPTYRALHDQMQRLAAHSAHARFVHMNLNKLVNRMTGIEAGQRQRVDTPHKAWLIVTQDVAAQAMRGAADHHDAYARAKAALGALGQARLGGRP